MSTFQTYREERAKEEAAYMIKHAATVRETARAMKTSKSTVHKDVTQILPMVDKALADEAIKVLAQNKAERHIRGGMATKEKYTKEKSI